jgi:hypothetical protein
VFGTLAPVDRECATVAGLVDLLLSHPVPLRAPDRAAPRLALTPEEFSDVLLSPEDRIRRIRLLVQLRALNDNPYRRQEWWPAPVNRKG